jgi:hypothetical protein
MSKLPRHGDLEISQDIAYTRKVWRFERIGWGLLALLIIAALAGLFGNGPLSSAQAHSPGGWWLEYERFGRRMSPLTLTLHFPADKLAEQVRVQVDRQYLASCEIQQITPQPAETHLEQGSLVYFFPAAASEDWVEITFYLQPQRFGMLSGQVAVDEHSPVAFGQFIYP